MNEETLEEIDARIDNGEETDEDIEILVDYFSDFMDELD